jgi:hypothetical protein
MAIDCANFISKAESLKEAMTSKNKSTEREIKGLLTGARSLEKNIDYCAFFTASLPHVNILDQNSNKYDLQASTGPYVVRAMASAKTIHHAEKTNQDYIFLENGYFGNYKSLVNEKSRKLWHRICVNMLQQETILDVPDDRWNALVTADSKLKWPGWKKKGSKILLVMPSSKPCQYYNEDAAQWKLKVIAEIKKHTDREIVIREKASRIDRTQSKTIYEAFDDDIFCTVTYQSIAAVESVAYGIPAFVLAPSAAGPVALTDLSKIETPRYSDPELIHKWCSSLAYGQFSLEEMLNGYAWNTVMENKNRATISS